MVIGSKRVRRLKMNATLEATSQISIEAGAAAVGYVRTSTESQDASVTVQRRSIRAFAESQGYKLVDVIADPGVSGATKPADRPGFARILELAEAQAFAVLLVYKFDRLARQIVYAVTAVNDLSERFGVVIRSVSEPIDTATPMGRTVFAVLAGMAEQERQAITERTHGGRREKATKGGFAGGSAPLGYSRDREGGLVIDERHSKTVESIFESRKGGATLQAIADALNADKVPTKRGGQWRPSQVGYILDNPKYRGAVEYLFRWQGAETHVLKRGKHKAIVKG